MAYDYREAMREDVREWIDDNFDYIMDRVETLDRYETFDYLYEQMWVTDSVTGNASGSYTFNTYKAREYVTENMELLMQAMSEFGYEAKDLGQRFANEEWEYFDVTIRCYLLSEILGEQMDDIMKDIKDAG